MPKLGLTMTEATLAEWLKREGDRVEAGEALFVFETDKSTLEFEAPVSGTLTAILVPAGQTVPVYTPVAVIGAATNQPTPGDGRGQQVGASEPPGRVRASPRARRAARELGIALAPIAGSGPGGRIIEADVRRASQTPLVQHPSQPAMPAAPAATPLARRVAAVHHIDLGAVPGSGRDGRITRADVEARVAAPAPDSGGEIARFTSVRAVTARRMAESAEVPQVTLFTEADATELVAARRQINDLPGEAKVSYNALLVAICGRALAEMPDLNASLAADGLRLHAAVNIGVAVDTERGLLVPVVRDVSSLTLSAISAALTSLVERALAGRSRPDDLEGGTFTITNLGMYDVDAFTPIVTPPQVAILGVGRIAPKVVPHEGQIAIRERVALSLSFDHRAVDGGPAARFLKRIKDLVERPYGLLMIGNKHTGV